MGRRRMATRFLVMAAPLGAVAMAFAACDSQGVQDDTPRFNYPVDAPDEDTALRPKGAVKRACRKTDPVNRTAFSISESRSGPAAPRRTESERF